MTELPARLVYLREACAASYAYRQGLWRPDPALVADLVAAERAHSVTVWAALDRRSSEALRAAEGHTDGVGDIIPGRDA